MHNAARKTRTDRDAIIVGDGELPSREALNNAVAGPAGSAIIDLKLEAGLFRFPVC